MIRHKANEATSGIGESRENALDRLAKEAEITSSSQFTAEDRLLPSVIN